MHKSKAKLPQPVNFYANPHFFDTNPGKPAFNA